MRDGWRGILGIVRPTLRPWGLAHVVRLMPSGVGFVIVTSGVREGFQEEFKNAFAGYDEKVKELTIGGVNAAMISGAPPSMVAGYDTTVRLMKGLEDKYHIPVFTVATAQVEALRALGVHTLVGMHYFKDGNMGPLFSKFFEDAGFEVKAMEGLSTYNDAPKIPCEDVYKNAKTLFLENGGADCIYILGTAWDSIPILDSLENDLRTTVITNANAEAWAAQKRLNLRVPIEGYGKLLREMP